MPTPVAAARQCLSPAAASALDSAVSVARRRSHAQTTSLHLISSLLAPAAPPLLRDALARARSSAYSPRLQLKALELCFAVSLDRLPAAAAAGGGAGGEEPPVSNSLMAAIKRSQANQRRNPDTFHLYHPAAAAAAQPPAVVKVELSQLVLAILDDPVVSRVFGEAGFRSSDIKLAILRPAPPPLLGRFPARRRPPPLFLCSFAAADADVPSPAAGSLAAGEENCRRIGELLARGRNPMLVGVGAAAAADDFAAASSHRLVFADPNALDKIDLAAAAAPTSGLVISVGDLKELVSDEASDQEKGSRVVAEVTRVLEMRKGRVWVMGWSATYETYLKFLSRFPLLDKDWELQLLPITSVRARDVVGGTGVTVSGVAAPASAAAFSKPQSLMESFVPFGGFFSETYGRNNLIATPHPPALRCQYCNDKYEQEVATIVRGSGMRTEDHDQGSAPSWLQKGSITGMNNGFDAVKVKDDQMVLNSKIMNLQKKWNDYCLRLHQGCQRIERDNCHLFPQYVGFPVDREGATDQNKGVEANAKNSPSAISVFQSKTTAQSISLSVVSKQQNEDFISRLEGRHSASDEELQDKGLQSRHGNLTDLYDNEDYASPSSAASVATDLVLGTPRESSLKEQLPTCRKYVEDSQKSACLQSKKTDDMSWKAPPFPSQSYACSQSSANVVQPSPRTLHSAASEGMSAFGRWHGASPHAIPSSDLSNYKSLVEHLFQNVERQEEALSAISQAIVQCRSGERRRGASRKNDIWFSFHGPDIRGKRRVAVALAEFMYGSKENLIYLDLSHQDGYDPNFRGKTSVDCIAEELSRKRQSVIFLDNADTADVLVQSSLSHAIQTGRFPDSRGKEISINDSIVVLSTVTSRGCESVPLREEDDCIFCEERILAVRGSPMKILRVSNTAVVGGSINGKVTVSPRPNSRNLQVSLFSASISKRKLSISGDQENLPESSGASKRPHRTTNMAFDLNLPIDEAESHDSDSSCGSHDNNSSENSKAWADSLFDSVDASINFKPFDFDRLADDMLKEISNVLSTILGPDCRLEIDVSVMEQLLAAGWSSPEDRSRLGHWLDQVLGASFAELKLKCKHSALRLVACDDALTDEHATARVLLPGRIILD